MRKYLAFAAALAVLVPAGATAGPTAQPATLFITPFVHKGYKWTIFVSDGAKDSLSIIAMKQAGKASQSHLYSFQSGVTFTANASLSSAKLVAKLGKYGTISMTFGGRGGLAVSAPPPPCKGVKYQSRKGALSGRPGFSFRADTKLFGKLIKPSLPAQLSRQSGSGKLDCGATGTGTPGQPTPGGITLTGFSGSTGERTILSVSKSASGGVTQTATVFEDAAQSAPATVFHTIQAPAAAGSFNVAADLSTATVTGVAPFLTGTATFTSAGAAGNVASGTITGNYAAKFDVPGAKTFNGLQATLIKS